jgi:orotate phosphoribosyltransferase
MESTDKDLALSLLQIKAIQLSPQKPFTWASGLKSPIYCDNRLSLSHPALRTSIKNMICSRIRQLSGEVNVIAGVATAGIPQATLVAHQLELPLLYVRSKPKGHGRKNLIEGQVLENMDRAVVIEDLISTGQSSLKAVNALREIGIEVVEVISIFTYGLDAAQNAFKNAQCPSFSLTNYQTLLEVAQDNEMILPDERNILRRWRENPKLWTEENN